MTPLSARLTFLGLIALAGAISANALYMQPPAETRRAAGETQDDRKPTEDETVGQEEKIAADKGPLAPYREPAERSVRAAPPKQPEEAPAARRPRSEARATPRARAPQSPPRKAVVRAIQRELAHRDYRVDRRDGRVDLSTRLSVLLYEYDSGLTLTGRPSEALLEQILFGPFQGAGTEDPVRRFEADPDLVARVQTILSRLGFGNLKGTGRLGPDTRSALREFALFRDLRPDGRLTPRLLLELSDISDEPVVEGRLR